MQQKGFTLVELLVVIAILAILTAAVVVILNPAELLRQSRDSQRMTDLDAMKNAIALYLSDGKDFSSVLDANCYAYTGASTTAGCGGRFSTGRTASSASSTQAVDGTGWLPLNLSTISSGSPLSIWPKDPSHGTTYYYAFAATSSSLTFEINAKLESTKFAGATNKEGTDGGNSSTTYEVGNNLSF